VTIHHLAYLLDLSDTRFFPIPSIDLKYNFYSENFRSERLCILKLVRVNLLGS